MRISGSHPLERNHGILQNRLLQNRSKRRAGIFGIKIDRAGDDRLLREERTAKVQFTAYARVQPVFYVLRDDLAQDQLFSEILRPYGNPVFA